MCDNFSYSDSADVLDLGMKIEFPVVDAGQKVTSIIATATAI